MVVSVRNVYSLPTYSEHVKHEQLKGAVSADASPGRPRSMVGLDGIQENTAALEATDNWRERSSSEGKILKKSAS